MGLDTGPKIYRKHGTQPCHAVQVIIHDRIYLKWR
jgi:hypothetical protein